MQLETLATIMFHSLRFLGDSHDSLFYRHRRRLGRRRRSCCCSVVVVEILSMKTGPLCEIEKNQHGQTDRLTSLLNGFDCCRGKNCAVHCRSYLIGCKDMAHHLVANIITVMQSEP